MSSLLLYTIVLIGAVGLYFFIRPGSFQLRTAAGLVGLGAIAYLGVLIAREVGGVDQDSPILYGIFGLIAIYGAGQMVSNRKPVQAALHFILVVIASAALFILMQAEFMAFALVIVYAGAILITYMFVLMLADQVHRDGDDPDDDRRPREPATAVVVGFIMLAVLCDALYGRDHASLRLPPESAALAQQRQWMSLAVLDRSLERAVADVAPGYREVVRRDGLPLMRVDGGTASVLIVDADGVEREVKLDPREMPGNTTQLGLSLVAGFPASLELAGVILTMAMFGAVVLARRQLELGEEQRREVMGLPRTTAEAPENQPARGGST